MEYLIGGLVVWVFSGWVAAFHDGFDFPAMIASAFLGPFTFRLVLEAEHEAAVEVMKDMVEELSKNKE